MFSINPKSFDKISQIIKNNLLSINSYFINSKTICLETSKYYFSIDISKKIVIII